MARERLMFLADILVINTKFIDLALTYHSPIISKIILGWRT